MTQSRVVRTDKADVAVTIEGDSRVSVGETRFDVLKTGPGAWRVVDASGRTTLVHVARSADGLWLHAEGQVIVVDVSQRSDATRRRTASAGDLSAPMPATVLSVVAAVGSPVAAGDVLLLLEAMKMELPVRASRSGTVTAVHCRVGELVQPGVPLVEIT